MQSGSKEEEAQGAGQSAWRRARKGKRQSTFAKASVDKERQK